MPGTFILAGVSISLALAAGLLLGIFAALRKDTVYDRLILVLSAIGMAGPSFFVAIIVAWFGAVVWRDHISLPVFPLMAVFIIFLIVRKVRKYREMPKSANGFAWATGISAVVLIIWSLLRSSLPEWISSTIALPGTGLNMTGSLYSVDVWKGQYIDIRNMILPVITLMIRPLAVIVQLTRSSMLEVMTQDYIRTARAKGLSEKEIIFRHALPNALNPVVTAVSGWFASLLAGAVFVEFVFGWKGLGYEMFTAIEKQDLPVVMGGVIVIAVVFVSVNILVDLTYAWIDPRVRVS
ncbi:MAG: ABC transporter permease [Crocinitomicaceae bacterium]|nr:ABC transporter permease [Crocinitomicaceae bacterium]